MLSSVEVCERLGVNEHSLADLSRFEPFASVVLPYAMSLLTVVIPSILASILYCRLARLLGIGKKWMLVSCVILAVLAALPICSVGLCSIPGKTALRWGVWNPGSVRHLTGFIVYTLCRPRQLMQFIVPLATGWWFMRRKHGGGRLQLAS